DCRKLVKVPNSFPSLQELHITESNAVTVNSVAGNLTFLSYLQIKGILDLILLPQGLLHNNKFLHCLIIMDCPRFQSFPFIELKCLSSLKRLTMGGFSEKQISFPFPNNENRGAFQVQQHLLALHELEIVGWSTLTSLPDGLQCLITLEKLTISRFPKLRVLPEWFGRLSSLQFLMIGECKKLTSLPSKEEMGRLTKLRRLKFVTAHI
ncbi:hypothetical protein GIB67_011093, partial [Kingdonia uniflora]